MAICGPDEKDITYEKMGAQFGVGVITVVYFIFILFIIGVIIANTTKPVIETSKGKKNLLNDMFSYIKSVAKTPEQVVTSTFSSRFTEWFTRVANAINSNSILAILAAGVVIGFNGLIMTPIISTMFPKYIAEPMQIPGRTETVNPGQFFIALIGFIISLTLFFFVTELIHLIRRKFKRSLTIFIILVLFVFLTFMLVWNGIQLDKFLQYPSNCIPLETKTTAFQLRNGQINGNGQAGQNQLPPFGIFG